MTSSSDPAILPSEASLMHAGAELIDTNPFDMRRVEIERSILKDRYQGGAKVISLTGDLAPLKNMASIMELIRPVLGEVSRRLRAGAHATTEELAVYQKVSLLVLAESVDRGFEHLIETGHLRPEVFSRFTTLYGVLFSLPDLTLEVPPPETLFSILYQVKRAYSVILATLRGVSVVTAHLRAQVWNAIFAGDLLRYMRWKHAHMDGTTWLILGDTGTGKELVARALAFARYLKFDEDAGTFDASPLEGFNAVNVSGLAVTLADSLLFGHKRGSFTGATEDAPGALAACSRGMFLFLDEVGDLDPSIQVKLLRVLEDGRFRPVGGTKDVEIEGKLVFATQPALFQGSGMRRDLRYRIHKNVIRTPTLRARLDDDPAELSLLVRLFAEREVGPYAGAVTQEVLDLIQRRYASHRWPGNVRELKVCVENVVSQHDYTAPNSLEPKTSRRSPGSVSERKASVPAPAPVPVPASDLGRESFGAALAREVLLGEISLDDLRERFIVHVAGLADGDYTEAADRLGIDRRTVRVVAEAAGVRPPEGERKRGGRKGARKGEGGGVGDGAEGGQKARGRRAR